MPRLPPLSAVRVFEAAARHQNFTQAAGELGMTQAAVSYQIRILEERLGAPLFARVKGRVQLTEAGRRVAPLVGRAFETLEDAFSGFVAEDQAVLSLSAAQTMATTWLAPRLGSFQVRHPDLAVRLSTDNRLVDFSTGEFHAAIRVGRGDWPGLKCHFLFRMYFSPICSAEDPGLVLDNQVMEANAAFSGAGIAMMTPMFWRDELKAGRLVQPFDHAHITDRSHCLVYPESRRNQPKIAAFRDWMLAEVAKQAETEPAEIFRQPDQGRKPG